MARNGGALSPCPGDRINLKTVVVIPTYDEKQNIPLLVNRLLALPLKLDLFFVDDASPDGTGHLLDELQKVEPRLRVLHRSGKLGLGTAYRQAFGRLLQEDYERYVAMDADFSHPPESIAQLLEAADESHLVIGSRYIPKGGAVNCPVHRRLLSRIANGLTSLLLGTTVSDATAGFRCYHRELLVALEGMDIRSTGYSFQFEMTYFAQRLGYRIREVPIVFHDRLHAKSKLGRFEIVTAIQCLCRLTMHRFSYRRNEQSPAL
jgi:dolichol-phosphate mannosyltransferase